MKWLGKAINWFKYGDTKGPKKEDAPLGVGTEVEIFVGNSSILETTNPTVPSVITPPVYTKERKPILTREELLALKKEELLRLAKKRFSLGLKLAETKKQMIDKILVEQINRCTKEWKTCK